MKFLVISDIHGRERVIAWTRKVASELRVDGIFVLGDITNFGPPEWAGHFLRSLPPPVYAIPGNCDPPGVIDWIERCAISLHRTKKTVEGQTFIGMGGSNPTPFHTPYEMPEGEIERALRPLMEEGAILVTHTPPIGVNDLAFSGRQGGSLALRRLVAEFPPRAVISGHIHEAPGVFTESGTLFVNPGAAKDSRAAVLEVDGRIGAVLLSGLAEY